MTIPKPRDIEAVCAAKGMRMTEQRRVIARVLAAAEDHPDVEELYRRCAELDNRISISTVYRTVKLFEDSGIIERHEFRDGRARYEQIPENHHDHLIDLRTGKVMEFRSENPAAGLSPCRSPSGALCSAARRQGGALGHFFCAEEQLELHGYMPIAVGIMIFDPPCLIDHQELQSRQV